MSVMFGLLVFISACQSNAITSENSTILPRLTFANYAHLGFAPATVGFAPTQYREGAEQARFPIDVERIMKRYLAKRFTGQTASRPQNPQAPLIVQLQDVSLSERDEAKGEMSFTDKFKRIFAGYTFYDVSGKVALTHKACGDSKQNYKEYIGFEKHLKLSNGATVYEREVALMSLAEKMIARVDPYIVQSAQRIADKCGI